MIRVASRKTILVHLVKPIFPRTALEHVTRRKGTRYENKEDIQCGIQEAGGRGTVERVGNDGTIKQAI